MNHRAEGATGCLSNETAAYPTLVCHSFDIHFELICHEANNREDDKACKYTCGTVGTRDYQCVPEKKTQEAASPCRNTCKGGGVCTQLRSVPHEHTHPVGTLRKVHFYASRVHLMLVGDERSLRNTTSNQLCKFPSPICSIESHRPSRRVIISALGLSEEGSNDDTICNAVFYSLPDVDICSLYHLGTNHHCLR